jgi:rhamnulose-1-phosphate aldolase
MGDAFTVRLREFATVSGMIASKGWAEANGGNVSYRLDAGAAAEVKAGPAGAWETMPAPVPGLAGECVLFTATGCFLSNIPHDPEKNTGVLELDEAGARFRIRWGFAGGRRPTSEWMSHLNGLAVRKTASSGKERSIVHAHTPNLVALTNLLDLDSARLTRLIWEMYQECVILLPDGVGFAPFAVTASPELVQATTDHFRTRRVVVWQYHGALAAGSSPETAFSRLEVCEKSAKHYLAVQAAGGFKCKLTADQLRAIARALNLTPDEEAMKL